MAEVVVVGGSIAGAVTALHLARAGRQVLILERAPFPRRKPCGEGLFPAGAAELARLELPGYSDLCSAPLRAVRFHAGNCTAEASLGSGDAHGLGIQRTLLDRLLLDAAIAAGARLEQAQVRGLVVERGRAVGITTGSGRMEAQLVVGADGLHSRIRRLAGLDGRRIGSRYGASAHAEMPAPVTERVEIIFSRSHEVYITPVADRIVNVAILAPRPDMRPFGSGVREAFEGLIEPAAAFLEGAQLFDEPLVAGPFARSARRAFRANVVLVGDAAGFLDGISGEGMSAALLAAPHAAKAIDRFLRDGDHEHLREYDRRRQALVRNSDLLARLSLLLAGRPALARLAVRNLARQPDTFRRLTAVSSGEQPLRSLQPRDAFALLAGL